MTFRDVEGVGELDNEGGVCGVFEGVESDMDNGGGMRPVDECDPVENDGLDPGKLLLDKRGSISCSQWRG